jgi:N-acetylneuraminate synthase
MRKYAFAHNKVASAMLTDLAFLEEVAGEGRHTFISTGMATIEAVDRAVAIFAAAKCPITLLHCVSTYPTDNADCNIRMVETLRDRYKVPVGYSGHERGMLPSTLAVMLGATAIERHITLDRTMYGSDQAASLEPGGLKRLVRDIRDIEVVLGDGMKRFLDAEKPIAAKLRYFERTE